MCRPTQELFNTIASKQLITSSERLQAGYTASPHRPARGNSEMKLRDGILLTSPSARKERRAIAKKSNCFFNTMEMWLLLVFKQYLSKQNVH